MSLLFLIKTLLCIQDIHSCTFNVFPMIRNKKIKFVSAYNIDDDDYIRMKLSD